MICFWTLPVIKLQYGSAFNLIPLIDFVTINNNALSTSSDFWNVNNAQSSIIFIVNKCEDFLKSENIFRSFLINDWPRKCFQVWISKLNKNILDIFDGKW